MVEPGRLDRRILQDLEYGFRTLDVMFSEIWITMDLDLNGFLGIWINWFFRTLDVDRFSGIWINMDLDLVSFSGFGSTGCRTLDVGWFQGLDPDVGLDLVSFFRILASIVM